MIGTGSNEVAHFGIFALFFFCMQTRLTSGSTVDMNRQSRYQKIIKVGSSTAGAGSSGGRGILVLLFVLELLLRNALD